MPTSPLIFIVGPTATGKTSLAFDLAKKLNADILSADSRQVYQGLEITSGVDIPANWSKSEKEIGGYRFYSDGTTQLYGVSFLPTQAEWSIAHFRDYAETIWNETQRRGKMLIIVGGSGLYHRSLFLDKAVLTIGPSESLREELQQLSVEELQHRLSQQLPQASELLNHSDWNNPRRLVRWIEKTRHESKSATPSFFGNELDHRWIGLTIEKEELKNRINKRVLQRLHDGAIQEIERLLSLDESTQYPSFSTLGVKDVQKYLNDQISKDELTQLWTTHEFQYAKRQLTWFKNKDFIRWFTLESSFLPVYQYLHID